MPDTNAFFKSPDASDSTASTAASLPSLPSKEAAPISFVSPVTADIALSATKLIIIPGNPPAAPIFFI